MPDRLIYRPREPQGRRKGFTETDYARLLDAAHQQVGEPLVVSSAIAPLNTSLRSIGVANGSFWPGHTGSAGGREGCGLSAAASLCQFSARARRLVVSFSRAPRRAFSAKERGMS